MGPWKRVTDKQTGRPYYYNRVTKQTSWNLPARIPAAQLRPSVMPEDPHVRAAVSVGMVMVMHAVLRWERHTKRKQMSSRCRMYMCVLRCITQRRPRRPQCGEPCGTQAQGTTFTTT